MTNRICGVPVSAFAERPLPEELARIVAGQDSDDQARFFMALGEDMKHMCGHRVVFQWQYIADSLAKMEAEYVDGSGSELLTELADRMKDYANGQMRVSIVERPGSPLAGMRGKRGGQ